MGDLFEKHDAYDNPGYKIGRAKHQLEDVDLEKLDEATRQTLVDARVAIVKLDHQLMLMDDEEPADE